MTKNNYLKYRKIFASVGISKVILNLVLSGIFNEYLFWFSFPLGLIMLVCVIGVATFDIKNRKLRSTRNPEAQDLKKLREKSKEILK